MTRCLITPRPSSIQRRWLPALWLLLSSCSDAQTLPPPALCATGSEGGCAPKCDPTVETCETKLALGGYCEEDSECSTEHCVPDEARRYRCCDEACINGCNGSGECFPKTAPAGTMLPPKGTETAPSAMSPTGTSPAAEDEPEVSASTTSMSEPTPNASSTASEGEPERPRPTRDDSGDTTDPDMSPDDTGDAPTELEIIECAAGATRSCSAAGALGNCGLGEQPCENGHWSTCTVQPKTVDSCAIEGDDADCDGLPNGGCDCEGDCEPTVPQPMPPSTTDECALGDTRVCDEHAGFDGKGSCRAGSQSCQSTEGGNRFGACNGAVGPANADSCATTGDDSNCNGTPNEGCQAMMPVEQEPTDLQGTLLWGFDSNAQGWQLRLTDPDSLKSSSQVTFGSDQGDPSAGSLLVKMPFSGHNQKMEFNVALEDSLDVRGKQFRARVMLKSGLSTDTNAPGGIKFFAKAGDDYVYVSGRWRYLTTPGKWEEVFLDPSAPDLKTGDFDLSDVREVGFELRTFQDTTQVSPAVVYLDSITY